MSKNLGIDIYNNPDLVLDSEIAAKVMVYGMMNGSFTNSKLRDHINGTKKDFFNARRIVNGLDKAGLIRDYAVKIWNNLNN